MHQLIVSASPHLRAADSTRGIMLDVILALLPAGAAAVVLFGWRSLLVMAVCVAAAVLSEYISRKIMRRDTTIGDLSAVVTGLLLAYNLPVTIPLWMAALGSAISIIVVKQLFGGLGQNFVNPALIGRIVLMMSFTAAMSQWTLPLAQQTVDAVTSATPLAIAKAGDSAQMPELMELFLGRHAGSLGETCALALLLGGVYLCIRRVITPLVPVVFVCTTGLLTFLAGYNPLEQILSGGLLLGAIFMATDYATTPINWKGKLIFAVGCGAITAFIRIFSSLPEGVSFSIIIMNIVTPHIDRLTIGKPFGSRKPERQAQQHEN